MNILVAGASGVVGLPLCRLLVADGHVVAGTTRTPAKAPLLEEHGVTPIVVDVFDAAALKHAVAGFDPEVLIHQLTDLPDGLDPALMDAARVRNTRIREEGTRNLIAAAFGVTRIVAQSIGFAYGPGIPPLDETAAIDPAARGVLSLEQQVLAEPAVGIVLRYGHLYGPGTGVTEAPIGGPLHVDAAADAARLAVGRGEHGAYNIAEDDGTLRIDKARRELGFDPSFRMPG